MPTRLLLDGDDLAELMLRIREEMGPHARVVKAERIRSGGFAGFFAREHYELTVEVPDEPSSGRAGGGRRLAPRAAGIDALVAAADAEDGAGAPGVGAGGVAGAGGATGAGAGAGAGAGPGAGDGGAPAEPPVSTASESFAQVLASVRAMVGQGETAGVPVMPEALEAAPGAVAESAVPAGGVAGGAVSAAPGAPDTEPGPKPFTFPRLDRAEVAAVGEAPAQEADDAGKAAAVEAAPDAGAAEAAPDVEAGAAASGAAASAGVPEEARGSAATAADLLELGVPVRLLEGFTSLTDPVPLSILVRRFARPPAVRLEPGVTVAVVGQADLALRTATQMAARAGLDGRDVMLAGEIESVAGHGRRLLTVAAASRHRSRRRADVPTVVALGVGEGPGAWEEAARLLAALAPEQAWGAVDARLRAADLRRWVRGVGALRELDALAVVGADRAQAPGVVLDVGTPVGWVDGLPATPLVWAALLSERLAADADWD